MLPVRYHVAARTEEAAGMVTLELAPDDAPIADPRPGQFTMLYAFGTGEVPISLSGVAADEPNLRYTIRDVGAVTGALSALPVGEQIGVRGPFGTAWGVDDLHDFDVVVVAGGLGLAPLRPAIRHLLTHPPGGRLSVLVGARTPVDILFAGELADWRRRSDVHTAITVDAARPGWDGDVGFVSDLLAGTLFDPERTVALVCGPEAMMRIVARALVAGGVAADRIRVSLERNMRCAVVRCGHCQLGPLFVCADGPVLDWATVGPLLAVRKL
jgi:NAD(P)H-flavin reductase